MEYLRLRDQDSPESPKTRGNREWESRYKCHSEAVGVDDKGDFGLFLDRIRIVLS